MSFDFCDSIEKKSNLFEIEANISFDFSDSIEISKLFREREIERRFWGFYFYFFKIKSREVYINIQEG